MAPAYPAPVGNLPPYGADWHFKKKNGPTGNTPLPYINGIYLIYIPPSRWYIPWIFHLCRCASRVETIPGNITFLTDFYLI